MNKLIPKALTPLTDENGLLMREWYLYLASLEPAAGGGAVGTVTGLNTDNTDPANPVVQISVDGVTITGDGTPGDPLISAASAGAVWGGIIGTLSDQTDLQAALDLKVPTARTISAVAPLSGGGDLSANRTLTTSMATSRLIGRTTAGAGVMEEISVGAGLALAAGSLANTVTQYTDELAQDAVGPILTDTATIDFTYNDGVPSITADVKDDSITYAKMQDVSAASRLIGRGDSGAGSPEEITLGSGLSMTGTTLSASDPVVDSVAYAASLALDWDGVDEIRVGALTGNLDITAMSNMVDGKRYVLKLLQDGTGGRTVTVSAANVRYSEDMPSLWYSTTASKASLFGFRYDGTDSKADLVAQVAGY